MTVFIQPSYVAGIDTGQGEEGGREGVERGWGWKGWGWKDGGGKRMGV